MTKSTASITTTTKKDPSQFGQAIRNNLQTYALVLAMIAIWILFYFQTDGIYLSPQNFSNLFRQMTITAIMSVGMVLVIVAGHIDLSVGKLAGYVSVIVAYFQAYFWADHLPDAPALLTTALSVLVGLLVGTLYGVVQGWIIAYLRVPSFITTLGSMWILNGLILIATVGKTIPANQPLFSIIAQDYIPKTTGWIIAGIVAVVLFVSMFMGRQRKHKYGITLAPMWQDLLKTTLMAGFVFGYVYYVNVYRGIQNPVMILIIIVVIFSYIANNTRLGRYTYAIGGNREAARLSGINIRGNTFTIFVLMGFLCGVSGVVMASYVGYGTIAAGGGYELFAIAACILGGTSTLGGVGTIFGAMIGSLIITSLTNGLQIMNVPSAWQYVISGAVLVFAVAADMAM
ncbi:MAG: sugar ABC transporter permease, partial [Anaerolineaceae bacterium]|nr:sugar ABC transporter permease [Anaerolineaceae bacterium]